MGKKTSKKPKGLSIARNNMKFACSWKKGESYSDKQQFSYLVNRAGNQTNGQPQSTSAKL